MASYERHVLHGVLAGAITGVVLGVLVLVAVAPHVEGMVRDIVVKTLPAGLAESYVEEVVESALGVARAAVYVAPVVEVVQYVLIGAIFGLVKGVFRERLGFGELTSAAAAGVLHILLLGAIPVLVISTLYAEILGVVSKYINLYLAAAAPGAVFAVSIVLVSSVRGPWTKLVEAKPREV